MDAGDTNKYVPAIESVIVQLMEAYRMNPQAFSDSWNIPESGNGVPDLLDEVKWELDFLKRMQDASHTNGLFLKVGLDASDGDVSPPSLDKRPRYYLPECTSSTIAGAAMFAVASIVYKNTSSQLSYGQDLLLRAENAWARAKSSTTNFTKFQTNCDDQNIKAGDADRSADEQLASAFAAAVYLYEATGKAEYKTFAEKNYINTWPMKAQWWGPYEHKDHLALLRLTLLPGVSSTVINNIRNAKASMNSVFSVNDYNAATDLYRAYLADEQFDYGHNLVRSNTGNLNLDFVTFGLNPTYQTTYKEIAQQHLNYLHGANPLGKVMLSNMTASGAEVSVNEIYHMWFADGTIWDNAQTSAYGPPPGFLVGGPNKNYDGNVANISNQPPQKAYKDWNTGWPENSWELTEPGIYYQAGYILLLSRVMKQ